MVRFAQKRSLPGAYMNIGLAKLFAGAIAVSALTGGALAADLPSIKGPPIFAPQPVAAWTGFYAGVNAGWASLNDNGNETCYSRTGVLFGTGCGLPPNEPVKASGFLGGGQIGYNWQANQFVLGVETDIQGAALKGSSNFSGTVDLVGGGVTAPGAFTANERLSWLGTARGRVGFLVTPALLLYGTGGLAYGGADVAYDRSFRNGNAYVSSGSATRIGWTAGGGAEYALGNNWSVKAEGLFYDLGSITSQNGSAPVVTGFTVGKRFGVEGAIARVGLNYRFGWAAPPTPVVAKY